MKTFEKIIHDKIKNQFQPPFMAIENESHKHTARPGAETHFKLTIVSEDFSGKSLLARHREIYSLFTNEMQHGIHALAIHAYTPNEWEKVSEAPQSPNCPKS